MLPTREDSHAAARGGRGIQAGGDPVEGEVDDGATAGALGADVLGAGVLGAPDPEVSWVGAVLAGAGDAAAAAGAAAAADPERESVL